jgi:hypothetical protein
LSVSAATNSSRKTTVRIFQIALDRWRGGMVKGGGVCGGVRMTGGGVIGGDGGGGLSCGALADSGDGGRSSIMSGI